MRRLSSSIRSFLAHEDGPTAVEYAVILALILLVCIGAVHWLGSSTGTSFSNSAQSIAS
jgi:pilus assembly protein Flp/PilA